MNPIISSEIQTLFDAVVGLLGSGRPEGYSGGVPLFSNSLTEEQTEEIRVGLQTRLAEVADGAVPVVTVAQPQDENQAGVLKVSFLKIYVEELYELDWFVDVQGDACWYFKTGDKKSARQLADFFNLPENRGKLEAFRSESRTETSLLKHWLLQLRPEIDVVKFGYKSTGQMELVKSDILGSVS
ncbi:hypothetical protein [Pseudomonas sp. WC2401]|uniref:Uncharacterized protein n=1 Tax=Pseudomonas sp. WC2401 TaxID=3234143 RepID=A0AB39WRP7_9PSED